jgi:hypothetical protein
MENSQKLSALQVLKVFLRLGLTSFGGPVAHLGYFREEFVARRKSLSEEAYADLVALCQFCPDLPAARSESASGFPRPACAAQWRHGRILRCRRHWPWFSSLSALRRRKALRPMRDGCMD